MSKLFDNIGANRSLDPDVRTDDATGEGYVDTLGYRDGMLLAVAGDITDTTGDSYTIKVYECDTTDGTYTDTGVSVVFTGGAAEDNSTKVARISELNVTRKRYLRADLVCSATTTSFEGGAVILLGEADAGPVNSD